MDEIVTMTVPPPLPAKTQARDASQAARQTVSIRTVSPTVSTPLATGPGATVFVGVSAPTADSVTTCRRRIPEVQSANGGCEERSNVVESSRQQRWQQAAHIVKIKINPDGDKNSRVISTVRLTLDENERNREIENGNARERSDRREDGAVVVSATNLVNERHCASVGEGCVRISVFSGDPAAGSDNQKLNSNNNSNDSDQRSQDNDRSDNRDMVHRGTTETLNSSTLGGRSSACFYYNSYHQSPLSSMVMSSGQCSPSDTLDSGTCSDLDGTPPPLPKKKNASTVILSNSTHNRTGSLTSSGAEVDSDDNESNISCDSLNGAEVNGDAGEYRMHETPKDVEETVGVVEKLGRITLANGVDDTIENSSGVRHQVSITELSYAPRSPVSSASVSPSPSGTSSLSKASSTPRVRSPDSAIEQNGQSSPVIKERTYEERKQREQERIEQECVNATQNRSTAHKYLYEDDRYYNFHVNELRDNNKNSNGEHGVTENDECFAGYKIHDKEAIRSAKGTVRGVKNRVRAGIATFLQSPTSKVRFQLNNLTSDTRERFNFTKRKSINGIIVFVNFYNTYARNMVKNRDIFQEYIHSIKLNYINLTSKNTKISLLRNNK